MVEKEMDACGDEHTANGCYDGKKGFFKVCQFPDVEFPLYLQPYKEEKYGHEAVIDPVFETMPEMEPGLAGAGVCQEDGYNRTAYQYEAAGFLTVKKFPE